MIKFYFYLIWINKMVNFLKWKIHKSYNYLNMEGKIKHIEEADQTGPNMHVYI